MVTNIPGTNTEQSDGSLTIGETPIHGGTPGDVLIVGPGGELEQSTSAGGAPPGAPTTSIQYNAGSGNFGGDANFEWTIGSGFTDLLHSAIGNFAALNFATVNPGDPIQQSSFAYSTPIISNEYFSGDLSAGVAGITCYPGFAQTSAPSFGGFVLGIDNEPNINSNSTNSIPEADAIFNTIFNWGSGNIAEFNGLKDIVEQRGSGSITNERSLFFSVRHRAGTCTGDMAGVFGGASQFGGTTTFMYAHKAAVALTGGTNNSGMTAVLIDAPTVTGGTAPSITQLRIHDATVNTSGVTGTGTTSKLNLWSDGISSKNWFEGQVLAGTGPNGDYAVNVNEACNCYNHAAFGGL